MDGLEVRCLCKVMSREKKSSHGGRRASEGMDGGGGQAIVYAVSDVYKCSKGDFFWALAVMKFLSRDVTTAYPFAAEIRSTFCGRQGL
jgi:hypothetical protein